MVLLIAAGCQPRYEGRPTARPTPLPTNTATPTSTYTPSPVPTVTSSPTNTPTPSPTPLPSPTPTFTPTLIPPRAATLFPLTAGGARTVDWSYSYISRKESRNDGSLLSLSATVAFQLLDRGIHHETLRILDQDVTVYYLRVSHTYNQVPIETRLVLTGYFGNDVPISTLPADGSAYISLRSQNSDDVFEPWRIHQDWQQPYEQRMALFDDLLLSEFERLLADLPDEVILLAHHPLIWPPDAWTQAVLDMSRISAQAARLQPFFDFDAFNILLGQSDVALAWADYLTASQPIPEELEEDDMSFSAEYLIIIVP
jgi:hypothetical protein